MTHHLRKDSKQATFLKQQFVEEHTKTFCGIKIIPLECFHGLQLPTNIDVLSRIFHMRATSPMKTIKDIVNDVNNELETIYQKGPFKMKGKDFRLKKIRSLHDDWRNMSKNETKISISKRETCTNSLLQICDLLAKGMLLLLGIS